MHNQHTPDQTTQGKKEQELLPVLETLPRATLANILLEILSTTRAERDRAFVTMIKTSASKETGEDEKAFYMGQHKALHENYTKIATIIAEYALQ